MNRVNRMKIAYTMHHLQNRGQVGSMYSKYKHQTSSNIRINIFFQQAAGDFTAGTSRVLLSHPFWVPELSVSSGDFRERSTKNLSSKSSREFSPNLDAKFTANQKT